MVSSPSPSRTSRSLHERWFDLASRGVPGLFPCLGLRTWCFVGRRCDEARRVRPCARHTGAWSVYASLSYSTSCSIQSFSSTDQILLELEQPASWQATPLMESIWHCVHLIRGSYSSISEAIRSISSQATMWQPSWLRLRPPLP